MAGRVAVARVPRGVGVGEKREVGVGVAVRVSVRVGVAVGGMGVATTTVTKIAGVDVDVGGSGTGAPGTNARTSNHPLQPSAIAIKKIAATRRAKGKRLECGSCPQ